MFALLLKRIYEKKLVVVTVINVVVFSPGGVFFSALQPAVNLAPAFGGTWLPF